MSEKSERGANSALSPYRVLDLTGGGCLLGGRMLADMGAEVIQIEPPGGSPSRIAPFYKDIPDPEKSLFWFAYCANKKGLTLDITRSEGQTLFKKLVSTADIVIESFEAGFMDSLKLGYSGLVSVKPDIILTSISIFGQKGPKAHYQGSDLTAWASGGYLYACGNPNRAPNWISFPQTGLFGGAEAAIGSLTALRHRTNTGEGQQVDVSLQECAISPNLNVMQMWGTNRVEFRRVGGYMYIPRTGVRQPIYFKCKDGYIMVLAQGGTEPFVSSSARFVAWMAEEGMAPDWLKKLDWKVDYDAATMGQEVADRVEAAFEKFTLTRTKAELYEEGAIKRGVLIAPVSTTKDISGDIQLKARDYWVRLDHPELQAEVAYCGPFVKMSGTPIDYRRRAPLIGEHNREIYGGELGISDEELAALKEKGIV